MNLSSISSRRIFDQAILLGLILLAAWLRFWRLASIPPGLWFDEAYYAMDAVWLRQTHTWPIFLLGNNGREVMFSYLLSLSTLVWGETAYAARLVPAFLGTLSIPLMYRWVLTLFKNDAGASGLALVSAAGLATSFWYVGMNRSSYRANLLPLFVLIVSYFFWRGRQTGQMRYYLLAGVGLGLSQYTYLSARLLPLVFILFVLIQTLLNLSGLKDLAGFREFLKKTWLPLLIMGGTSALVGLPLFLFFLDHPEAFWGRVSDVAIKPGRSAEQLKLLGLHLWSAVRVFIDGEDPNWRHHLLGRPVFDWFSTFGFWLGLIIAVRRYRQPLYLFLLVWLMVMWLPAPLSEPVFHTLRLSGLLPAYYVVMGVGLINALSWIATVIARMIPVGGSKIRAPRGSVTPERRSQTGLEQYASHPTPYALRFTLYALIVPLLFSGVLTFYDYFYRWAEVPAVYQAYEGPVVDLTNYLSMPQTNLIIPFYLYTHASTRYLLSDDYREDVFLPPDEATTLRQQKKVSIIIPTYPPDDNLPPAFVWLIKTGPQAGAAYVSAVKRGFSLAELKPELLGSITGSRGTVIAQRYQVDTEAVLSLFPLQKPSKPLAFKWADNLRLTGYEFAPASIKSDAFASLFLSWQILGYTGLDAKMFVQMLDSQGNPVGQKEVASLSRKMYRWRDDGLILEEHPLDFAVGLKSGLYFVRLGFFNPKTDQRLPVHNSSGQSLGDQIILGPLYVRDDKVNPIMPQYPTEARLGDAFEILGYSLTPVPAAATPSTEVTLYWQTRTPVDRDYTAFVQLLDGHSQLIGQQDHQPLNGLYPTSRWQPGDIIADKFVLPAPVEQLSAPNQLMTGMYDLATGTRLPAFGPNDQVWPDNLIRLNKGLREP